MTTDLELPIFRPRMGSGRGSRSATDGARSFRNALLARVRGRSTRAGAPAAPVHPRQANARRVIIKAHVQRMGPSAAKAAALHVRYIERDGVERDGSKGVLYDAQGPARAMAFEQPRPGEKHQFRLIISPEDGSELDLTAYVRRLMATLERDVGRPVEWAAVNHHDTSHPHAHVVIRGIDREGREEATDRPGLHLDGASVARPGARDRGARTAPAGRRGACLRARSHPAALHGTRPGARAAQPAAARGSASARPAWAHRRVLAHRAARASRGDAARRARLGDLLEARRGLAEAAPGSRLARRHPAADPRGRARRPLALRGGSSRTGADGRAGRGGGGRHGSRGRQGPLR